MKVKVLGIILIGFGIICCESKQDSVDKPMVVSMEESNETTSFHCYLFSNGKDSIRLSYQMEGNDIKGWMNYDFFEKDGSVGEVEGEISGDTLKLEYEFLAEGMISKQEVYFLKKEGKLFRGATDMEVDDDSVWVYKEIRNLKFEDSTPLEHLDTCPQDLIRQSDKEFYMEFKNKN